MSRQLAFELPPRAAFGRADYFVAASNAPALAAIDGWQDWPQGCMLLVGPLGAGKTHLAHVWAAETGARLVPAAALSGIGLAGLHGLAGGPLGVEDAETCAGDPAAEAALFHLHNLCRADATPLLLTASRPVRDWGLRLPDLESRMQAIAVTRVAPPDDALLAALLVKLFADRQIAVTPPLIAYLLARMDRSFAAARALVAALDATALAVGRPVTRAMAAALLDSGNPLG